MKRRIGLGALAIIVVAFGATAAFGFHDGGVAECIGCHSMHNPNQSGIYLLNNIDQSSTCLDCHTTDSVTPSSYHMSTDDSIVVTADLAPTQRTPGGDFGWIKRTYSWSPPWGGTFTEDGDTHGHNIIALDYNFAVDGTNATAPGGNFASSKLGCQSCHDPHGTFRRLSDGTISTTGGPIVSSGSYNNSPDPAAGEAVGVYRLLAGDGYLYDGLTAYNTDPPAAVAPSGYNRSEAVTQTRVAYGTGTSEWCGTCHEDYHTDSGRLVHPVAQNLGSTIKGYYDAYRKTGDATGTNADAYLSLIAFEENSTDYTTLKLHAQNDDTVLTGPASNSQVMCLSCHRAHASGFEYGIRWNPESELLTYNGAYPGTDNGAPPQYARGRTEVEMIAAYNDYPATDWATFQRSLCNKCHIKD